MKSISASLVVFAGATCILGGPLVSHGDTQTFVMTAGVVVTVIGLGGWIRQISVPRDE